MTVKVLIKRRVPEEKNEELVEILKELRARTLVQPGYLYGETLARLDKTGESMVISTWKSMDDFMKWVMSPDRIAIQDKIDALLKSKTVFEIYKYT